MRNRIPLSKPRVLYLLCLTWQDARGVTFDSPLYVGDDKELTPVELEEVGHLWLEAGIEKRAKGLLKTKLLQTITL